MWCCYKCSARVAVVVSRMKKLEDDFAALSLEKESTTSTLDSQNQELTKEVHRWSALKSYHRKRRNHPYHQRISQLQEEISF